MRGLVKHYPGVKALDGVDLVVRQHEVLGLAGENGAGKSTLLKALVGLVRPDAGEICVRGEKVRLRSVVDAADHGIGMVFQEQSLVPNLTAAENIVLGSEGPGVRRGIYRWDTMRKLAQEQLDKIGSDIDPLARTDTLTFADRQMVEIAKVLRIEQRTQHPPVIILDEPTSVLESKEIETLFTQIRRLREFASVVFVSHRLDEVLDVCDRVSVLRGGQSVGEVADGRRRPGRPAPHDDRLDRVRRPLPRQRRRASVRGAARADAHASAGCRARRSATSTSTSAPGRSSRIVGVHGSGREDVCRALFGAEPTHGRRGHPRREEARPVRHPRRLRRRHRLRAGRAQDRGHGRADVGGRQHDPDQAGGPLRRAAGRRRASRPTLVDSWIERLSIRTPHRGTAIQRLSGGNQQKVVLARWLVAGDIRLLLLDHPTRGLDIGARSEVYRLMRELANSGVATVLLADSLEEAIGMADRIVVMSDGRVDHRGRLPLGRQADPARPREGDGVSTPVIAASPPPDPAVVKGGPTLGPAADVVHAASSRWSRCWPRSPIADPDFLTPAQPDRGGPDRRRRWSCSPPAPRSWCSAAASTCRSRRWRRCRRCSSRCGCPDLGGLTTLAVIGVAGADRRACRASRTCVLRIPSFIVTLGGMSIFSAVALVISDAGADPGRRPRRRPTGSPCTSAASCRSPFVVAVVVVAVIALVLKVTPLQSWVTRDRLLRVGRPAGRHARSTWSRSARSRVSGACAGLAAVHAGRRATSAAARRWPTTCCCRRSPRSSSAAPPSPAATAACGAALVGALVVTLLRVGLPIVGVPSAYEQILYGAIIVVAVALTLDRSKVLIIK